MLTSLVAPIHELGTRFWGESLWGNYRMKYVVWICIALLLVLHQDYWQWDDATLDFGFMPRALTFHVVLSVVAAVVWLLATQFCWPSNLRSLEEFQSLEKSTDQSAEEISS
ncbi:MAG: hypothetical protein HKN47_20875 [Pirellulaceae bacterium]|nr:hypothetical protein [Pirellulaceae bacterium]